MVFTWSCYGNCFTPINNLKCIIARFVKMSSTSAGIVTCEPTQLYNITQDSKHPAILSETYLTLFDSRSMGSYHEAHIVSAKSAKKDANGEYRIPFGVHLPSCLNCVVYDSNTVSIVENTPAVQLANKLACSGSKNPIMILKGGYERFSAEYPFLRTQKIIYTDTEIQSLPCYPSEIMPLFLYLGDRRHAYNASLNYELKIRAHLSVGNELYPAFPEGITELHLDVQDKPDQDLLSKFEEIFEFIETQRKMSDRVLVFSELGVSRAATAVIAYLMKRQKWSLKEAFNHVQKCRHHVRPLTCFLEQLSQWEAQIHGESISNIDTLLHA